VISANAVSVDYRVMTSGSRRNLFRESREGSSVSVNPAGPAKMIMFKTSRTIERLFVIICSWNVLVAKSHCGSPEMTRAAILTQKPYTTAKSMCATRMMSG
jgi:hypothetical protein